MNMEYPPEPIMLQDKNTGEITFRTYAHIADGTYKIYLPDNSVRIFTDEDLPDPLKILIGLINAYKWEDSVMYHEVVTTMLLFTFKPEYPPALFNVGWRDGDHYCLVIPQKVFNDLRGVVTMSEEEA